MTVRLNITLADDVVARADEYARRQRYSRSGLIAAALEAFIAQGSGTTASDVVLVHEAAGVYATGASAIAVRGAPVLLDVAAVVRGFFVGQDDVAAAWIFGSVARGQATRGSDVDIALLPRDRGLARPGRFERALAIGGRLASVLNVEKVDVVWTDASPLLLAHRAVTEGVLVFGDATVAAEEQLRVVGAYLDHRPLERERERILAERIRQHGTV